MKQAFRAARRIVRWLGPPACAVLLLQECANTQWTSAGGGAAGGIAWESRVGFSETTIWTYLLLLLAFLTVAEWVAFVIAVVSRRPNPRRCPKCDYDLSGLSLDAPCPECGSRHRFY